MGDRVNFAIVDNEDNVVVKYDSGVELANVICENLKLMKYRKRKRAKVDSQVLELIKQLGLKA